MRAHGISDEDMLHLGIDMGSRKTGRSCNEKLREKPRINTLNDLVQAEAAKRDRNWDAKVRWKVLQETITSV